MIPVYKVDAFTEKPYSGNPAAVCLLDGPADPGWMLLVAAEMNLAETAFVYAKEGGDSRRPTFRLRWFSISGEVDLCGHATLAAAHILWERGLLSPEVPAEFDTLSGPMFATRNGKLIELDFPADPVANILPRDDLVAALGAEPSFLGRGRFYTLARFADEAAVRALKPDFAELAVALGDGIVCTARSADTRFDIFSRFFAPALGNPEDTVTGSSACLLGPYWAPLIGRNRIVARQENGRTGRGGTLTVTLAGDRVKIGGTAVTVLEGYLLA